MPILVKITMLIFLLAFQNVFADICDFEYKGYDYDRDFKTCSSSTFPEFPGTFCHKEYGPSSYRELTTINKPDTTIDIFLNSKTKVITIRTFIKEGCLEQKMIYFDSLGNLAGSYGFIEKDNQLLQVTFDNIKLNINYIEAPCSFSVIDSLGKNTDFHFNGLKNDIEYEKLKEKFPKMFVLLSWQLDECEIYKKYVEYFNSEEYKEHLKRMDLIIKSIK